ncbi:MAG: phosphoenolpyruvate--protein phosphotransferase, partial [Salinispira sp.]
MKKPMKGRRDDGRVSSNSVSELVSILEKKGTIQEFFFDLVAMVSRKMNSPLCAVYLHDSKKNMLVLRAGTDREYVDQIEIKPGEGIVGKSFESAHPINEGDLTSSPFSSSIPGMLDTPCNSLLSMPIRRGTQLVGVIIIGHEEKNYFTPRDIQILRTIVSQLAGILGDAEFFMEASLRQDSEAQLLPSVINGTGIGQGICIGTGIVFRPHARGVHKMDSSITAPTIPNTKTGRGTKHDRAHDLTGELTRFAISLKATKEQLEDIQQSLSHTIAEVAEIIFSAHMLMLRDVSFSDAMQAEIESGKTAGEAIVTIVNRYVELFSNQSNPRVQEKVQDVLDLGHRLIKNLSSNYSHIHIDLSGQIIVLADTFPSEMVTFAAEKAEGLVLLGGGETAHIALLAKSLNLPVIFVKDTGILDLKDDSQLIIDVDAGQLLVNPSAEIVAEYEKKKQNQKTVIRIHIPERCRTEDGRAVKILANINLIQDVEYSLEQKAEGIGLYRSEFPFLVRNGFPSEEEQVSIYERIIEPMGDREVVLRTLDAGGDKLIGHHPDHQEANPFLGYRGIRFSLDNKDIFAEQLRAILRGGAGSRKNIGILFPMIGSLEECIDARNMVYACIEELQKDNIPCCENPKIGAMIELPSAAEIVGELAEECDFLSIGSNDLIMYLLAVDRTNEKVEGLYKPWHPSVLRVFNRICEDVGDKITELSVCGEAGADPALIPFFIGRGIHKLSVDPKKISTIKNYISSLQNKKAEKIADDMLALKRISDVEM